MGKSAMMKYQKLTAVAVIDQEGYLSESAPVLIEGRKPDRINWILLTDNQRSNISRWLELDSTDTHYQGKYPEALPQGYVSIDYRRPDHWHNALSQWVNAQKLHEYIENRSKTDKYRDTIGMEILRELIKKAAEL